MRLSAVRSAVQTVFLLILISTLPIGCAGMKGFGSNPQNPVLPAIIDTPTNIYHPGKFVWHDLLTHDARAARIFYAELFGWSFVEENGYLEIYHKGRKIGGVVEIKPENKAIAALWLPTMSVNDLNTALARVKQFKGKVLRGPVDMPLRGRGALVEDQFGAQILLLHAKTGDPDDREPETGHWLWNEIWSSKPEESIAFYRAVGAYSEVLEGSNYAIFINEGLWRAGIRFSEDEDGIVRWVPAVRVADPEKLLARVEELGGVVWVRPGEVQKDAALISDNSGALLILQSWDFDSAGPDTGGK